MCHTYLVTKLPKKGHECEHAIHVTGSSIRSHMYIFLKVWAKQYDCSDATTVLLTRTPTAGCTHRGDDGWKTPLCAEKSIAVETSLLVYASVQNIHSKHTGVHGVGIFLHCCLGYRFPRMAVKRKKKGTLRTLLQHHSDNLIYVCNVHLKTKNSCIF